MVKVLFLGPRELRFERLSYHFIYCLTRPNPTVRTVRGCASLVFGCVVISSNFYIRLELLHKTHNSFFNILGFAIRWEGAQQFPQTDQCLQYIHHVNSHTRKSNSVFTIAKPHTRTHTGHKRQHILGRKPPRVSRFISQHLLITLFNDVPWRAHCHRHSTRSPPPNLCQSGALRQSTFTTRDREQRNERKKKLWGVLVSSLHRWPMVCNFCLFLCFNFMPPQLIAATSNPV